MTFASYAFAGHDATVVHVAAAGAAVALTIVNVLGVQKTMWMTRALVTLTVLVLAFIIVFVMLFAALRRASGMHTQEAIIRMAGTVLATLYLGGLAWFLLALQLLGVRDADGELFGDQREEPFHFGRVVPPHLLREAHLLDFKRGDGHPGTSSCRTKIQLRKWIAILA